MVEIGSLHIDRNCYKLVIAHFSDILCDIDGIRYMYIQFSLNGITLYKNYY